MNREDQNYLQTKGQDLESLKRELDRTTRLLEECLVEIHELRSDAKAFRKSSVLNMEIPPPSEEIPSPQGDPSIPALLQPLAKASKQYREDERLLEESINAIGASNLFDEGYYIERYPDVRAAGSDPLKHYLQYGAAEGRDPSPHFSTLFYLENNPDVANSGTNPLIHYVDYGMMEGRLKQTAEKP